MHLVLSWRKVKCIAVIISTKWEGVGIMIRSRRA